MRRRLLGWLLVPLLLLIGGGAFVDYFAILRPANSAYDQDLVNTALALAQNVIVENGRARLDLPLAAEKALRVDQYDHVYYSIFGPGGEFVAGNQGLPGLPEEAILDKPLYYDGRFQGMRVRLAAMLVSKGAFKILVQAAETTVKRERLTRRILIGLLAPEISFAVAAVAIVWFGIARGLAPLEHLRAEIASRSHRDLRPVPEDHAPIEARPVVRTLNELLKRLESSSKAQQRFIAEAAHQLRTPLAGLQTQVELALQQDEAADRQHALEQLKAATERATHLANQLLVLARSEPDGHRPDQMKPLDLRAAAQTAALEWTPLAIGKNIDLGFEIETGWTLAEPLLVHELLSNLIDNAIRYTQTGGWVTVRTGARDGLAVLEVLDNGPGIPSEERENVFKRFYRVEGSPGDGCGLGLAIALEIAHAHDATVKITTPSTGRGTQVTVLFKGLSVVT